MRRLLPALALMPLAVLPARAAGTQSSTTTTTTTTTTVAFETGDDGDPSHAGQATVAALLLATVSGSAALAVKRGL